ncbi:MAG: hypothetical protein WC809_09880, partial [Sinimarinibacterium sp.]
MTAPDSSPRLLGDVEPARCVELSDHALERLATRTSIDPVRVVASVQRRAAAYVGPTVDRRHLYLIFDPQQKAYAGVVLTA